MRFPAWSATTERGATLEHERSQDELAEPAGGAARNSAFAIETGASVGAGFSRLERGRILALQRTAGNRAVTRLIASSPQLLLARAPLPPEVVVEDPGVEEEYLIKVGGIVIAEFIPADAGDFAPTVSRTVEGRRVRVVVHHRGGLLTPISRALAPAGWQVDLLEVDDRMGEWNVNPPSPVASFDDAPTARVKAEARKAREREEQERKRRNDILKAIAAGKWDIVAKLLTGASGVEKASVVGGLDDAQLDRLEAVAAALKDPKGKAVRDAIAGIRKARNDAETAKKVRQFQEAASRHLWDDAARALSGLDRENDDALLEQLSEAQLRQLRAGAARAAAGTGMGDAIDKAVAGRKDSSARTWENQRLAFWLSTGQEILAGKRSDLTFDSYEGALAYAQSLGRPAAVMQEGLQFAVYDLKGSLGSWRKEDVVLGSGRTRIEPMMVPVRAFVTSDGWAIEARLVKGGYQMGEATLRYGTGVEADPFAGQIEAFGEGLARLVDHDAFMAQFERAMRELVLSSLDRSKEAASAKRDALRDHPDTELAAAKQTASELVAKDRELAGAEQKLRSAREQLHDGGEYDSALRWIQAGQGVGSDPGGRVAKARQKVDEFEATKGIPQMREQVAALQRDRVTILSKYPLLSWVSNPADFDALGDAEKLAFLRDIVGRRVPDSIEDIRARVLSNTLDLWAMGNVVSAMLVGLGVTSPQRRTWVKERVEHAAWVSGVTNIAIAVVGIGLAIGGIFYPPLLVVSFAVNTGLAVHTTFEYLEQQSLSSTDLDRSKALLSPDAAMGWGWVAAAFIGIGLEGAGLLKALRAVGPAAKLLEAGGTLTEFEAAIAKAGQLSAEEQSAVVRTARARDELAKAFQRLRPAAGQAVGGLGFLGGGDVGPLLRQLAQVSYLAARQGIREFSAFTAWLQRQYFRLSIDFSNLTAEERRLVQQAFEEGRAQADAARRGGADVLYASELGGQVGSLRYGRTAGTGGISRIEARELPGNARGYRIEGEIRDSLHRDSGPLPAGRTRAPSFEGELPSPADVGQPGYRRAHQWGPGWGDEARAGIMYAPESVNNRLQSLGHRRGIEGWVRGLNDKVKPLNGRVRVSCVTESHPRVRPNDPLFLKSAQYDVIVEVPGQTPKSYRAHIDVPPPPGNRPTVEITELTAR